LSASRIPAALLGAALLLGACGDSPVTPDTPAPVITVGGVEHGRSYGEPVTIQVGVDRGSFDARLNGDLFFSGSTVRAPGGYRLEVSARNGTATRDTVVEFSISAESMLIIRMLDLGPIALGGSGDAIVLTDSSALGRRHAVIDAGVPGTGPNQYDYAFVANRLQRLGADTLEFLQLTHAHADHYGGMQEVLQRVHVREFVYNGQVRTIAGYQNTLTTAQQRAGRVTVPQQVTEYSLGGGATRTVLRVIPPLPSYINQNTNDGTRLNEGSLGTELVRGSFRMFFTGDGEYEANARWRTGFAEHSRNVTVLKVGHHGANNAIFDSGTTGPSTWLTHTAPRVSIISSNGDTHPRIRALERLLGLAGNRTYCTHVHGSIEIRVSPDGAHQVNVERNASADCVPGSEANT
jgi:beta-lactamase superfamily II metal-dependent hydrolase